MIFLNNLENNNLSPINEANIYNNNWVCLSVNPSMDRSYGNKAYFKAYNASNINRATKEIRLHFYDIGYEIHNDGKELWKMNKAERKRIVEILKMKVNDNLTVWQSLIRAFNQNVKQQYIINENIPIPDYTLMRW